MSVNVNITSDECAWSQFEFKFQGRTIKGIRGFSLKVETEVDEIYGAGSDPLDLNEGNTKNSGSLKLLGFEVDNLNKAAKTAGYDNLIQVPHEASVLTVSFKKKLSDPITTYTARGVKFTEWGAEMEQGAKMRETTLPFKAMAIF